MKKIPVKIGLQQRVMPEYRVPFFDALAEVCPQGLHVFAGQAHESEAIDCSRMVEKALYTQANNLHLMKGSFYTCVQTNFMQWLEEWQPEALIVEANPRYLTTPQAVRWMHARKRPVIGWGLGAPRTRGFQEALRYRFLQSLDGIIAYSDTGAEQYLALGCKNGKVFVAPNSVSAKPTLPAIKRPDRFAQGKANLIYVGRLQKRKKLDLLLQACARLPGPIQPHVTIIGDGPELENLRTLAAQVYTDVDFVGGKFGEELEPLYKQADLFVLPGTGGLAVQQAMAHSLPVIVGEADGTQGQLVRPENGWLLEGMLVETLAATLQTALQDTARLRRMGLESYRIVAEEVNLERMVDGFVDAVNTVVQTAFR
jgi:glycosyltransferase involved in cell wall biosynthesis